MYDMQTEVITQSDTIQEAFDIAISGFAELHNTKVKLIQRRIPSTTMRAQPTLELFPGLQLKRIYKIEISYVCKIDNRTPTADLPLDVLVGWMAHELGHVRDYYERSNLEMLQYGFKYLTSHAFKKQVERQADIFAIQNGYGDEIIQAKRYILSHADLDPKYKRQLEKYYCSIEEIEEMIVDSRNDD